MKKYIKPSLSEEKIEIVDIINSSSVETEVEEL